VIQQVQSQQLHVQDNDGNWRVLQMVPYRTIDNRIDGVVLSVMDEMGGSSDSHRGADGAETGKATLGKGKRRRKPAAKSRRN
jgi:two-component system, chemotaxis family, CheB/CheR fusion protein